MKKVTLGGERLGNGKKIKVDMHGWGRSTFDQSRIWRSTMGVGMLIPCFNEVGLPGTTFDIDINTLGHTIPTISPLFGSFKLQVDLFACPIRLYQGILHNNAVNIGLDMSQVLVPQITIGKGTSETEFNKVSTTSLNNYLGIKGRTEEMNTFNGIRHLAYYDIFKNYYSNKQEEYAKVIGNEKTPKFAKWVKIGIKNNDVSNLDWKTSITEENPNSENTRRTTNQYSSRNTYIINNFNGAKTINEEDYFFDSDGNFIEIRNDVLPAYTNGISNTIIISADFYTLESFELNTMNPNYTTYTTDPNKQYVEDNDGLYIMDLNNNLRRVGTINIIDNNTIAITPNQDLGNIKEIIWKSYEENYNIINFELENIDDARRKILSKTNLNQRINLNEDLNFYPYKCNFEDDTTIESKSKEFQGLCLKTYQNDIYNCWLSTEYVDKINNLTSITTDSEGNFSIDAFILAKKVYNILNRIAINGGTYEDWQESVYGEDVITRQESPIYIGGTSAEITFEEVVATTSADNQALGTLGGKGIMTNKKGGNIVYKCNEPCIIMGIASITPRVDYYQGNDWFMTNIENMDNLHKPGLDGIGFQDLIENNIVWTGSPNVSMAKTTAWINYQTAINEVFGQFALDDEENSLKHMVLRRNYETTSEGEILDFTSYIDPSKFNYAFADNSLKAQNFWMQIGFNVKSRRKMATSEIPNL